MSGNKERLKDMLSGAQLTVVGQAGSKMKRAVDGLGTRSYPVHPRPVSSGRTPEAGVPLSSILAFQAFKDVSCTPRPHLSLPLPSPVSLSVPPSPTLQHTATATTTMSYTVDDLVASLSSNHINQEAIDLQDVRVCATRLYAIFLCVTNSYHKGTTSASVSTAATATTMGIRLDFTPRCLRAMHYAHRSHSVDDLRELVCTRASKEQEFQLCQHELATQHVCVRRPVRGEGDDRRRRYGGRR